MIHVAASRLLRWPGQTVGRNCCPDHAPHPDRGGTTAFQAVSLKAQSTLTWSFGRLKIDLTEASLSTPTRAPLCVSPSSEASQGTSLVTRGLGALQTPFCLRSSSPSLGQHCGQNETPTVLLLLNTLFFEKRGFPAGGVGNSHPPHT